MLNHNQDGQSSGLVISMILVSILFVVALIFGFWAYSSRQDYKNNVQGKINTAVTAADAKQQAVDNTTYNQKYKYPLNTYDGPEAYGSIVMQYPKSWSGYLNVDGSNSQQGGSGALLDGYFNQGTVPSINDSGATIAVHLQVLGQSYSQVLQNISNTQGVTSVVYTLPKLASVVGVEVSGNLSGSSTGTNETMVILPDRSDTIELSTEGSQNLSDFNSIILANFSFSP
jgi:hypothetical protein